VLRQPYPSDLSDAEWIVLEPRLPAARPGGRPRAHPTRELIDAML
jgi:putative transposase